MLIQDALDKAVFAVGLSWTEILWRFRLWLTLVIKWNECSAGD